MDATSVCGAVGDSRGPDCGFISAGVVGDDEFVAVSGDSELGYLELGLSDGSVPVGDPDRGADRDLVEPDAKVPSGGGDGAVGGGAAALATAWQGLAELEEAERELAVAGDELATGG